MAPLQLTIDAATGIVWGWGPEAQHAKLVESLKPLQEPLSVVKQEVVVANPLSHADPVTLKPVLAEIHKDINVVADAKTQDVDGDRESRAADSDPKCNQTVDQRQRCRSKMRCEPTIFVVASGVCAADLQVMWPEMKFTVDAASNRIVATGNTRDQQAVKAAIDQLNEPGDGQSMEVKTYAIPFGVVGDNQHGAVATRARKRSTVQMCSIEYHRLGYR